MELFDLVLVLDKEGRIASVRWHNERLSRFYGSAWNTCCGSGPAQSLGIPPEQESGSFTWNSEHFWFERFREGEATFYFVKRQNHREALLEAALDTVKDGVQVYDKNADVVYLNKASRFLSGFGENAQIEGRNLMDLYPDLDEDYSTALTTLRTCQPVQSRFGDYESLEGKKIITLNTGYPVLEQGELLGTVVQEQDIRILQDKMQYLEKLKAAMAAQISGGLLRRQSKYSFSDLVGHSREIRQAVELAERVSLRDGNVLLVGETGTGKEIFAQSIHYASPRQKERFVSVNCAAVPETLIESVLFGTTKGAFTGSVERAGLFEEAGGGTLFLDELNSMSMSMQSKLLRVLQEGTFRRTGGSKDIHTNVRIISACNENPYQLIEDNKLRRDLFYRVGTIMIDIPPLRERLEDVEELAYFHLKQSADRYALNIQSIDPRALQLLRRHSWPGNVRELNHAIDYAINLCTGDTLLPEHLPPTLFRAEPRERETLPTARTELGRLQDMMDSYESEIIRTALRSCGGNVSKTAALLDIKRQSLQYRIHKYNIIF